jgi:hypothetical protein
VDVKSRRRGGLTDKVRRVAQEFDFSALLSGVRDRRPTREPAFSPVVEEKPAAAAESAPAAAPAPPAKPMAPSVMEDQAAELRAIWNPQSPAKEEVVIAPPAPWQRSQTPVHAANRVIVHGAGRYDYERDGHAPPYWQGVLNRAVICVGVIIVGVLIGAGTAPLVRNHTAYRVTPVSVVYPIQSRSAVPPKSTTKGKVKAVKAVKPALPTSVGLRQTAPRNTLGIVLPIGFVIAMSLLWIAGLPLFLGPLEKAGFILLLLGVLFSAGWNGANGFLVLLENRESAEKLRAANQALIHKPAAPLKRPTDSANKPR